MVLFKRKAVEFVPPPELPSDFDASTQVFFIPETGEWFLDYDKYLDRMDYYNIRKFVCEITGNSNFNYFEALKYEKKEMEVVEEQFPEPIREPILRFVQFSTINRLDQLVDTVYNMFRKDYFPGDLVSVKLGGGDRVKGSVREKARFNSIVLPNGEARPAYCTYRVALSSEQEIAVDESQLARYKNTFTKWHVKTFLKLTLTRSPKLGAPWTVKPKYAIRYRLPMEYPEDLRSFASDDASVPSKKTKGQAKKPAKKVNNSSTLFANLKETAPTNSADDPGALQRWKDTWYEILKKCTVYFDASADAEEDAEQRYNSTKIFHFAKVSISPIFDPLTVNFIVTNRPYSAKTTYPPDDIFSRAEKFQIKVWNYDKVFRFFKSLNITIRKILHLEKIAESEAGKDGIDENSLINSPSTDYVSRKDVEDLKLPFQLSPDRPHLSKLEQPASTLGKFSKVSELLETWLFLNMFKDAIVIDTFTFDDFLTCMAWNDTEQECELFDEVWCSVLKGFMEENTKVAKVNSDSAKGLLVTLPSKEYLDDELFDDGDESMDEGDEDEYNASITSEDHLKEKSQTVEVNEAEIPEKELTHTAHSYLDFHDVRWKERLATRDFKNGGWQIVLIGILSLVEEVPDYLETIKCVFEALAPPNEELSGSTLKNRFLTALSLDLRVQTLKILIQLLMTGKIIRGHMDFCLDEGTRIRKERMEQVRVNKTAREEAIALNKDVREMLKAAPRQLLKESANAESNESTPGPIDDEMVGLKKGSKGRRSALSLECTPKEMAYSKSNAQFRKLLLKRTKKLKEAQESIRKKRDLERSLSEIDIQRATFIGKDRLYNRYWWFESNGLPSFSKSGSSEDDEENEAEEFEDEEVGNGEETYMMGRLWIQGPSEEDRTLFLNFSNENLEQWKSLAQDRDSETHYSVEGRDALSFIRAARGVFNFSFGGGMIRDSKNDTLIDQFGGTTGRQYSNLERKLLEEKPDPVISSEDWRFIDNVAEFENLIKWLNYYGKRESVLRQKLVSLKPIIVASISNRRKALLMDSEEQSEVVVEKVESSPLHENGQKIDEPQENGQNELKRTSDEIDAEHTTKMRKPNSPSEQSRNRCLEWVNSAAVERLGTTHYLGAVSKKGRGRKKHV